MVGSGGFPNSGGPTITASATTCGQPKGTEDDIAPGGIRPKWLSVPSQQCAIPGAIGFRIHRAASLGWFGDSVMQDEIEMESHEKKNESRNEKDMCREEAAQRGAANGVARHDEVSQPVADDRHFPGLLRPRS